MPRKYAIINRPTVTVIIPAYRASRTIRRAVDSLLSQTRPPDEVLVIDDGSPEDLSIPLESYGERVTLVRQANGGAASARNTGIEKARGDWLAFLDADDFWEPEKLERQLQVLDVHPQIRLITTGWYDQIGTTPRVRAKLSRSLARRYLASPRRPVGRDVFEIAMLIWTSTVLVRREDMIRHRFESGLEPAEDRDMWIRLVSECPTYLIPDPLATYVQETGSLSRSNVDRDCGNMLRVINRYKAMLGRSGYRKWKADLFRRWASGHLEFGRPAAAFGHAWKRLQYHPISLQAWWIVVKCATYGAAHRASRVIPHFHVINPNSENSQ